VKQIHPVFLRTPVDLVERVDRYKAENGLRSRTQAILVLIATALDAAEAQRSDAALVG